MSPDIVFNICNALATLTWLTLIVAGNFWTGVDKFVVGIVVTLLAIVYSWLVIASFDLMDMNSFGSVRGVMDLFRHPMPVVAGWVHYLAFDLMTGVWIKKNAFKLGVNYWIVIPCLLLTFLLGPMGLLLYLLVRWVHTKQFFAEN